MFPAFIKIIAPGSPEDKLAEAKLLEAKLPEPDGKSAAVSVPDTNTVVSDSASVVSSLSDQELTDNFRVHAWDKKMGYSDFVHDGLRSLNKDNDEVVMLFEAPSSSSEGSSFFNSNVYKFHDYPPACNEYKMALGPCRYSMMNGSAYPSYLHSGSPPLGLLEHWEATIPGFRRPSFVSEIPDSAQVYAYLPCESVKRHLNDPSIHYHLAGKDALVLMTKKTTKMLPNTRDVRPCVAKTTHSMASKGIFIIRNDEDEVEFQSYLQESGNPTFVVTEYVEIERNAASHFFIHPNGDVTVFGCNENYQRQDGSWSMDSYLIMNDQVHLKEIQLPFIKDIAQYCNSLGFWGFCGIDVLFDKSGQGFCVDVNPRVTGSCPALMVFQLLKDKYGFDFGLFRRNGDITYYGSYDQLFAHVESYNAEHQGQSMIVVFGAHEKDNQGFAKINVAVYGHSVERCEQVLYGFCQPSPTR
jgi:hypothetical protein